MVCLIAGIILLAASLIQDISGSGAGWRGPALIIGAIGILLGMYLFPTLKHHRSIVNFIFVFPLLFTFVVTVIIPLCLGVFYSFTDWNGIKMTGFVGFANYKAMFNEPSFLVTDHHNSVCSSEHGSGKRSSVYAGLTLYL